ncbi:FUSC family protein [Streptomyces ruber]|uniref:FUSC family protein n=2 Tax=Streptomyces TaxID=1883 RepID=A0A918BED3_9ACTN|nr:FUSC family protein [Streptomyces ruber]GGQ59828.1 FUSC family protein [Streptomyces ruber]
MSTSLPQFLRTEAHALNTVARNALRGTGRDRDLLVQSLKAAAAALIAWVIADEVLNDPMAMMAPWVAVVLVQATVYSSLRQGAQQFAAICVGAVIAAASQALTGGNVVGALAVCMPVLMLLSNWHRFGDQGVYAATTALFTLTMDPVTLSAVGHRLGQAALGAVIGIAVNALVFPPIHLRDVRENMAALAHQAGDTLHTVAEGLRGEWDASTVAEWSSAAGRLERRLDGLVSARGWSEESLRLTASWLSRLHRVPLDVPPTTEDDRWSRVTGHVRALTRALAVAADENRTPGPPDVPALHTYARLLELIGDSCHAEARRIERGVDGGSECLDDEALATMDELHEELQGRLREQAGQGAAPTAVLGTLLLQAENLWAETVRRP